MNRVGQDFVDSFAHSFFEVRMKVLITFLNIKGCQLNKCSLSAIYELYQYKQV